MNDNKNLEIKNFHEFLLKYDGKKKPKPSQHILELLKVVIDYYYYALASFDLYQKLKEGDLKKEEVRNKIIATAFGVYTNGRVCLDVSSNLNSFVEEFAKDKEKKKIQSFRGINKNFVKDFINKRNIVAIHPTPKDNHRCDCFPNKRVELSGCGSLGLSFRVISLITNNISKKYEIKLNKDLEKLQRYLEDLASIYEEFFLKDS